MFVCYCIVNKYSEDVVSFSKLSAAWVKSLDSKGTWRFIFINKKAHKIKERTTLCNCYLYKRFKVMLVEVVFQDLAIFMINQSDAIYQDNHLHLHNALYVKLAAGSKVNVLKSFISLLFDKKQQCMPWMNSMSPNFGAVNVLL